VCVERERERERGREEESQLSIIGDNKGRKFMDNPKPRLKQKQSKHGTKWI
jgi:hypothetical protein